VRENHTGTLDFYETIRSATTNPVPAAIDRVIRDAFSNFLTDVDYRTDGLGAPAIHPFKVARSVVPGVALKFDFSGAAIAAGQLSRFYFIKTNATAFDLKGHSAIVMHSAAVTASVGGVKLLTSEPIKTPATTGSISGVAYNDMNGNGSRQVGEPALPSWKVFLDTNHNGAIDVGERTTLTDAAGHYTFAALTPGVYDVREVVQPGWHKTQPVASHYDAPVIAGAILSGYDFSNTRLGILGGKVTAATVAGAFPAPLPNANVFLDANNNGIFDLGEKNTKTDAAGHYSFVLNAGNYVVRVQPLAGFVVTTPATGKYVVALGSGQVLNNLNFVETHV
jgi:hypothetical protein